jgi:steroid 5-alpha reductase family enzyme
VTASWPATADERGIAGRSGRRFDEDANRRPSPTDSADIPYDDSPAVTEAETKRLAAIPIALALVAALAWAGSRGGVVVGAIPLFAICVATAIALQWVAFLPAYQLRTERFYDLTGSITYIALTVLALGLGPAADARSLLLAAMIVSWAARLGLFLFTRILAEGADPRFDAIRGSGVRFFVAWTLQGVWVCFTAGAALAAITGGHRAPLGVLDAVGLAVWVGGFAIESVADRQKRRFRSRPENAGRFISTGLWAWSRHPNYFGEIVLWTGVGLVALPALEGWQLVTLISPVFVTFLITRVSGVPLLEQRADARWGDDPEYRAYKARTPVLVPGVAVRR